MKATEASAKTANEAPAKTYPCVAPGCKKIFKFPYGRWDDGGACSKDCDNAMRKARYPNYEPELVAA